MLSKKIQNVANSLGVVADKVPEEVRSFLAVCQSELADAADLAVEFESQPLFHVPGGAEEAA
jgi:hypothetical protein